jgi:hypothetical protein
MILNVLKGAIFKVDTPVSNDGWSVHWKCNHLYKVIIQKSLEQLYCGNTHSKRKSMKIETLVESQCRLYFLSPSIDQGLT